MSSFCGGPQCKTYVVDTCVTDPNLADDQPRTISSRLKGYAGREQLEPVDSAYYTIRKTFHFVTSKDIPIGGRIQDGAREFRAVNADKTPSACRNTVQAVHHALTCGKWEYVTILEMVDSYGCEAETKYEPIADRVRVVFVHTSSVDTQENQSRQFDGEHRVYFLDREWAYVVTNRHVIQRTSGVRLPVESVFDLDSHDRLPSAIVRDNRWQYASA